MKNIVLFSRVTSKEKVFFARQLSVLISAGVAIDNALNLIKMQTRNEAFKKVLTAMIQDIEAGESLSIAISKFPRIFNNVFIAVVKSGEVTGKLTQVLTHLADQMENTQNFINKVRSALAYPIFIIIAMVGVIVIMMIQVVPKLKSVFEEAGAKLPWTTRALIAVSDFMVLYWWLVLIILIVLIFVGWLLFTKTKKGRFTWDVLKLKTPLIKYVSYDIYMERFCRTISMLSAAGIPIIESIKITARAMNNRVYIRILKKVVAQVEQGIPMSAPLEKEKDFPVLVPQMIMVGEQTGRLETIMQKMADYYENEVDYKVKTITSLVEPVTIVIVGVGVGFVVYSIFSPIYSLVNVI